MLFIVSAPSGAGKGTIINQLRELDKQIRVPVSSTTRERREGEVHGVDYYFDSHQEFQRKIHADEFVEWKDVFRNGKLYGTLRSELQVSGDYRDVMLEIDTKGAIEVKLSMPWAITIFILPPSPEQLILRLKKRARGESEEEIQARIRTATEEISRASMFEYWIENRDLDEAVDMLHKLILSLRHLNKCRDKQLLFRTNHAFSAKA